MDATMMRQQLIKRLEALRPSAAEAQALVERLKQGTASAGDRQRLMAILEAEQAALEFLASLVSSTPPIPRQRPTQPKKQKVKQSRCHHRP
jgi:hypothetical protein